MHLPYPMEAFDATTDNSDHLCALQQSPKSSSHALKTSSPASLCLLFLPHLHTNPTGTTGPARILRALPRLPPCQPIHRLSRAKCGGLSHIKQGRCEDTNEKRQF